MIDPAQYVTLDAVELAALIRAKEIHPREAVTAAMVQIERHEPTLNALTWRRYDRALREAEQDPPDSPLAGVPFLIKDLGQALTGAPNTLGSKMRRYVVADHDSSLIARHKTAGLIILGQTNAPEFGAAIDTKPELHGVTKNPWDTGRSPGGSSGGAAAAAAARYVPIAHASDGGGSIRIPASMCGLFGLKPTRGRTPKGPDVAEGWFGMSVDHAVGHSVRDSAALLDVTHGPDAGAPYFAPPPDRPYLEEVTNDPGVLRIAVSTDPMLSDKMDAECIRAVEATADLLEELGHEVTVDRPQIDGVSLREAMSLMVAADVAAAIVTSSDEAGQPPTEQLFEHAMWVIGLVGRRLSARDLAQALALVKNVSRVVAPFFDRYDVFVESTLARPPWKIDELDLSPREERSMSLVKRLPGRKVAMATVRAVAASSLDVIPNTPLWNATGQPSMSVPLHWSADGLPVGVQFTGRYADEATLFRLAAQLEQAQPWADRLPPIDARRTA